MIGRSAGLSEAEIQAARSGTGLTLREGALARFAIAVVEARGQVVDTDLDRFTAAGFSGAEAIEVVALVALNTLTNCVNHLAGTEVDFPRVDIDRVSAAA